VKRGHVALSGLLLTAFVFGGAGEVGAQAPRPARQGAPPSARPPFRPGSIEVDGGVLWLSGIDFGSATAGITANQTPATEYPLCRTASQWKPAPAYEGRIGVRLTRVLGIESSFQYARAPLETRITGDVENAPSVTASNDLSRYLFEMSAVVHLTRFRLGRGGSPFVLGGAGYLRELDDAQALVETGRAYHGGAGFKYLLSDRPHGLVKGLGIRADARLYFRDGGFDLADADQVRRFFAGGASLLVAF
jgi:hypothetical protein